MAPLLEVRNLKTHFYTMEGVVKAVDGVTFDVLPARTLGIVGESGCGKSVAVRSILQIVESPGRIVDGAITYRKSNGGQVEEIDLTALAPYGPQMRAIRGGEISMIFQEPMTAFSPQYTIGNQIVEAIRVHSQTPDSAASELAMHWLDEVGIPNPARRMEEYPHQLSGGQRQRAMIAMALVTNPKILIADEPTTALDVTTQAQITMLLQRLQADHGMAILYITHDLGVIAEMAHEVVVMYLGSVVEKAPIVELFHSPKHPYTQALMTSRPSIYAKPRERLPSITGSIPHPLRRPTGCPFHPRCPRFMPGLCEINTPKTICAGPQHEVDCFLYGGA
jgi:peptide/nickel transport system ATP-binding protein